MRILAVCQHYRPEPFNVSETCEELARRGHSVTVLTGLPNYPEGTVAPDYRHGRRRDEVLEGVRVVRVPIVARGADLRGLNKLRRVANYLSFPLSAWLTRACLDERFDCVLCFQYSPVLMALPALRIARREGVPCVVYSFDLWPEDMLTGGMSRDGRAFGLMRGVSRRIYASADLVAVTSPGFPEYFSSELGLAGLRTEWLPQYAEPMFEGMSGSRRPRGDGRTVFTFAGNVGGNQSVETIVRAAALLGESDGVVVRVAGSGSRLEACRRLAGELGAGNVEFLGRLPLDEMPEVYASSDAMLLTLAPPNGGSLVPVYTIPRKLQSYLAAGMPVVAAVEGVAADIVRDGGCGVACRAGDPAALAGAIREAASLGAEGLSRMGAAARALYEREFSRERFFGRLESMLDELVSKGNKNG